MIMGDEVPTPPSKKIEVVLRDLEVLLRKELGKNLIEDNFTTSKILKACSRLLKASLDETEDKFDHNAVILMENLKVMNYTCGDRRIGVDLEHAKFIVKTLAHSHALGIAIKLKKPDSFEKIKKAAKCMEFKEEMMKGVQEGIINDAKKIPALLPLYFEL